MAKGSGTKQWIHCSWKLLVKVKKIRLLFLKNESQRNFLAHPVLPQFLWVRNLDTAYLDRLSSGLTGLNSCVSQGCGLIWGLTREESASVGRLGPCGSRALGVSFLLAVGWRLPSAPYHVDLPTQSSHTWQLVPWKLARELMFSYSSSFIIDVTSVSPLLFL